MHRSGRVGWVIVGIIAVASCGGSRESRYTAGSSGAPGAGGGQDAGGGPTLIPDTDGLLGGRFRGVLSPEGRYEPRVRPFVPDAVAEVADLGRVLDDLLPPLPPRALAVGDAWSDGAGLELRRLPDSVAHGRSLWRLALRARAESNAVTIRGDTTGLKAAQVTTETGEVDWDARKGLVRRTRHIVVETSLPAGGPLKLPLRSRLEQDATLTRGSPHCTPGTQ